MADPLPPPPSHARPPTRLRQAFLLNLVLPGAGLFVLGQRRLGVTLAAAFLACLLAALAIFLAGYARYLALTLSGDILEGDQLERIARGFHPGWLSALAAAGAGLWIAAMILLWVRSRALVASARERRAAGSHA
jgi:hypothetical protein